MFPWRNMTITFAPLTKNHFSLMLTWLQTPHVKPWWDRHMQWTLEKVEQKFGTYADGYKLVDGIKKPMHAFIIEKDKKPIGYIQLYDVRDFKHPDLPYDILPAQCAGLDLFIGDVESLGNGRGTQILQQFLTEKVDPLFNGCVVDPVCDNVRAIKAFEKAGFTLFQTTSNITWMLRKNIPLKKGSLCS